MLAVRGLMMQTATVTITATFLIQYDSIKSIGEDFMDPIMRFVPSYHTSLLVPPPPPAFLHPANRVIVSSTLSQYD